MLHFLVIHQQEEGVGLVPGMVDLSRQDQGIRIGDLFFPVLVEDHPPGAETVFHGSLRGDDFRHSGKQPAIAEIIAAIQLNVHTGNYY